MASDNPINSPAVSFTYYSGPTATGTGSATAPTNAGTWTVVASFAGNGNYNRRHGHQERSRSRRPDATVNLTWADATYNGNPHPATATVTGPVASDNPINSPAVSFTYYSGPTATGTGSATAPTNAGTWTVVASFAGNGNYNADTATKTIEIAKAPSVTSVTCPARSLTYNGSARTPCTASVTGAGGLNESLTVNYTDNTNAGTAHASASFAGEPTTRQQRLVHVHDRQG